jgi:hypothetical protein
MIIITDTPRRDNDLYPTPFGLCKGALSILPDTFIPEIVIDPGCGDGRWGVECKKLFPNSTIIGIDIKENIKLDFSVYSGYHLIDYVDYFPLDSIVKNELQKSINLVIGNPPYKYTEEFIRNSLDYLEDGGYLLFLLRLDFLASETRRKNLWREFPPKEVYICSKRPSFNTPKNRRTDGNNYAIYLWEKGIKYNTEVKWLEWSYDEELDYE